MPKLDDKRKIQKMIFPEGIVVDTTNRTYLISKVNFLFLAKPKFMRTSGDRKEKLLTGNDEEFSLVAETVEISNLLKDINEIINLSDCL